MTHKLKKFTFSVMAVASLTLSAIRVSVNAASSLQNMNNNIGQKYLSVSSDSMFGYTKSNISNADISISLQDFLPRNGATSWTNNVSSNKIEIHVSGKGFTYGKTSHTVNTVTETISVWA